MKGTKQRPCLERAAGTMNHLKLINQYLTERGSIEGLPSTGLPFVTISREVCAGGHLLAHAIQAEIVKENDRELFEGWHVFDRDLCEIIAADPSLEATMESLLAEAHRSEFKEFVDSLFTGRAHQYTVYKKTFRIVRALTSLGKVIIVGRAGACVTGDLPSGIHIRLIAPEAKRVHRLMKKLGLEHDEALTLLHSQEEDKRALVKEYFNKNIEDPTLYDVVWNSANVDMHDICHSTIDLIKRRARAAVHAA